MKRGRRRSHINNLISADDRWSATVETLYFWYIHRAGITATNTYETKYLPNNFFVTHN